MKRRMGVSTRRFITEDEVIAMFETVLRRNVSSEDDETVIFTDLNDEPVFEATLLR